MSNSYLTSIKSNYFIEIFEQTKNKEYIQIAYKIVSFVTDIYRIIEPSHFSGKLIVFKTLKDIPFENDSKEDFYDKGVLNHDYSSIIFKLQDEDTSPLFWKNISNDSITKLLNTNESFICYLFENQEEFFIVNNVKIKIPNNFSCPSIYAPKFHDLKEALLVYKNDRVRTVSSKHFKDCWADNNRIYFKNKPEKNMQIALKEFLEDRIRGIKTAVREYNLGASKPVDIRVFWSEANRAALLEVKWLGQSLNENGHLGTSYYNGRVDEGMRQIKEYIDLERGDTPTVITKGYLIVIDGRRRNISQSKVQKVSRKDGMHYSSHELRIGNDLKYWTTHPNIGQPIRMFVEPICEI
jgi:hypothetical protein